MTAILVPNLFGILAVKDFRVKSDQPPASERSHTISVFQTGCPLLSHREQAVAFAAYNLNQWVATVT